MADRSLYFECSAGISGDMAVAAMLDAGADQAVLKAALDSVPLQGFKVEISRVKKSGIECCDFDVIIEPQHSHRHLSDVLEIIDGTKMTDKARSLAHKMFQIVAEAESKAHNVPVEEVHFHEVGAVDSIVDVIALAVCFDNLAVDKVYVPRMNEGTGTVQCQHGILPVPVPAVVNIAAAYRLPLHIMEEPGEFITPTGAAFVAAVRTDGTLPAEFKIEKVGLGAGKRSYRIPSILRAMVIKEDEAPHHDVICKLETNIDDCTGEALGFVMEQLFEAGARDVHYIPCFMKKNRPGYLLTVLCDRERRGDMERIIFTHTTTIGIRHSVMERTVLERKEKEIQTPYGPVKAKVVISEGKERVYPEYESIAAICRNTGEPFYEVYKKIGG